MDIYGERQVQADVRTEAKVKLWEWRQSIVREEKGKEVQRDEGARDGGDGARGEASEARRGGDGA